MALTDLQTRHAAPGSPNLQTHPDDREGRLSTLRREHLDLGEKIEQMERALYLTPAERLECSRLKKLKLQKKDQIALLERLPS